MRFRPYIKIKQLGHEDNKDIFTNPTDVLVIEEKVDGANFRFMVRDGKLVFGSRTQELHPDGDHKFQKAFTRCIAYVQDKWNTSIETAATNYDSYIFYGENMVRHTMDYQWDKIPPFLGFDIFDQNTGTWLDSDAKTKAFATLGLTPVPVLKFITCAEVTTITDDDVPISAYAPHKAEGIVIKNYTKGIFAKYVREEFKEKNAEVFGSTTIKYAETPEAAFCARYCTNARIDKAVFKLLDEGFKLDLPMMAQLPRRVWTDIWSEEWEEIIQNKHPHTVECPMCKQDTKIKSGINFDECRRYITRRCLAVLKQIMSTNAMQQIRND